MLWRVWKIDGRYRLVTADTADEAAAKVKDAVRVDQAHDRHHPVGGRG